MNVDTARVGQSVWVGGLVGRPCCAALETRIPLFVNNADRIVVAVDPASELRRKQPAHIRTGHMLMGCAAGDFRPTRRRIDVYRPDVVGGTVLILVICVLGDQPSLAERLD